jgi:hypothetical protein
MTRWFVTLSRAETPTTATPVIAITDTRIVGDVIKSVGKHLGITPPTPLRSVTDRSPDKSEGGER